MIPARKLKNVSVDEDQTEVEEKIGDQETADDIAAAWILVKMKNNIF